jgi:hypothetical protein
VCAWGEELTRTLYPGQNRRGDGERAIYGPSYPPPAKGSQARKERLPALSGVIAHGRQYGQRPTAGAGARLPEQIRHIAADRGSAHAQLSGHGRLRAPRGQPALDAQESCHFSAPQSSAESADAVVMPSAGSPTADFLPRSGGRPEAAVVARFCSHGCLHASVAGRIVETLTAGLAVRAALRFRHPDVSSLDFPHLLPRCTGIASSHIPFVPTVARRLCDCAGQPLYRGGCPDSHTTHAATAGSVRTISRPSRQSRQSGLPGEVP